MSSWKGVRPARIEAVGAETGLPVGGSKQRGKAHVTCVSSPSFCNGRIKGEFMEKGERKSKKEESLFILFHKSNSVKDFKLYSIFFLNFKSDRVSPATGTLPNAYNS